MIKTAFTFALGNSKTATQEDAEIYLKLAMASLDAGGATWTAHAGAYTMDDGTAVIEPSYTLDTLTAEPIEPDKVRRLAEFIKRTEKQESVLVEITTVNAQFI
jgi:hypothetical protein